MDQSKGYGGTSWPKTCQSSPARGHISAASYLHENCWIKDDGEVGHRLSRWNVINLILLAVMLSYQYHTTTNSTTSTNTRLPLLPLPSTTTSFPNSKDALLRPLDSCNPPGRWAVKPSKAKRVQCLLHLFHNHMTNLDVCNASMKQTNYIVQTKKYLLNLLFTLIGKIFSGLYRTILFQLKMFFTGVASFHAKSFFQLCSEIPLDLLAGPLEQFPPHALRQWLESLAKPSLQLFVPSMASKICLL